MSDPVEIMQRGEIVGRFHSGGAAFYAGIEGDIDLRHVEPGGLLTLNRETLADDLTIGCFAACRVVVLAAEDQCGPEFWDRDTLNVIFDEPCHVEVHGDPLGGSFERLENAAPFPRRVLIVASASTLAAWMRYIDGVSQRWTGRKH